MSNFDQQKPGGKSARSKKKRNKKAEQQQAPARAASEPIEAVVAPEEAVESVAAIETAPAAVETALAAPVERVASFKERMASVMPPTDTAPAKPAAPPAATQPAPLPATPDNGIQALANAYRDYTRKSLEDAQSFAEKLSAARTSDKAVEAQTEFAKKACETFTADSRKIRELHRELFWQAFRLPNWPLGRT